MTRKPKSAATITERDITLIEQKAWARARAEVLDEIKPQRDREKFEAYKRAVRSKDSGQISAVIYQALSNGDVLADTALREHLAETLDKGLDVELNLQLRFYLVQYLIHPLVRPLQQWVRDDPQ